MSTTLSGSSGPYSPVAVRYTSRNRAASTGTRDSASAAETAPVSSRFGDGWNATGSSSACSAAASPTYTDPGVRYTIEGRAVAPPVKNSATGAEVPC
ncbi:MAG: hypothetical protein ACTHXE_08950 [Corynebacterium variabile]|uniref:hypothetical protein n=1 Tax=Corynebacterium variabile TaxID=1727 RepID=UPI003F925FA6